jgi:DNA-binding MarR family transcriptional regulator
LSSPESSGGDADRDELVGAILRVTADLAGRKAAYGATVAERMGLAAIDVDVLTLLAAEGAAPVGRIGEVTGLTTGATTRLVDRLEQAGFVRRVADPVDRRRVIVEPAGDRASAVVRAYAPLEEAGRRALNGLDEAALRTVHSYLVAFVAGIPGDDGGTATTTGADTAGSQDGASVGAPVASATSGRLVMVTAGPAVSIGCAANLGTELYRARFSGAVPSARVRDGLVTIRYPRFAWFDWRTRVAGQSVAASAHWRRDASEFVLNAALPWSIELRGGSTSLDADLRDLRLTRLDVGGGTGDVTLRVARPVGVVRVGIRGGAGDVLVTRPAGTAATLSVTGGHRSATLDGAAAWSSGHIASAGAESAPDRLEIEVTGGANRVTVREG